MSEAKKTEVDKLREDYDRLAAEVPHTAPESPERFKAMEAKKLAFLKWREADASKEVVENAKFQVEIAKSKADAAKVDLENVEKAQKDAAKLAAHPAPLHTEAAKTRPVG